MRETAALCIVIALVGCVADHSDRAGPTVRMIEEQRIGAIDGSPLALTRIGGFAVSDAHQRLYIGQPQEAVVKIFTLDGRYVGKIGSHGGGPGEFSSPGMIGVIGDTIWVLDDITGRLTYFSRSGSVLQNFFFPSVEHEGVRLRGAGAPMIDGTYLGVSFSLPSQSFRYLTIPLVRRAPDGAVIATLARFAAPIRGHLRVARPGGGAGIMTLPLTDGGFFSRAPDGSSILIAEEALDGEAIHLVRIQANGDTALHRSLKFTSTPVPATYIDSVVDELSKQLPGIAIDLEPIKAGLRRFQHFPPVTAVTLGEDGVMWIRRENTGADSVAWDVLKPDGTTWFRTYLAASTRVRWARDKSIWRKPWIRSTFRT